VPTSKYANATITGTVVTSNDGGTTTYIKWTTSGTYTA